MLPGLMHDDPLLTKQLPKIQAVNVQQYCSVMLNVAGPQQVAKHQQQRSKAASTMGVNVQG